MMLLLGIAAYAADVQSWMLDDGTEVVLVEDHRTALAVVGVQVPVGSWSPWFAAHHGDEAWSVQLHDPDGALRERADALAATVALDVGQRRSRARVSCLSADLDEATALLRDTFRGTAFDEHELHRIQKGRNIGWAQAQKDFQFRLHQAVVRELFASDDPRRQEVEKPGRVEARSAPLVETRNAMLALPGRIVGFAGDVTREQAERLARTLLPPVGTPPADLEPVYRALAADRHDETITLPRLTQSYFAYLRDGPMYGDADYPAWLVASHVLAGHFFSRLYVALRHESGDTYGVGASGDAGVVPESYALWTFTRTENAGATRDKLLDTVKRFHDEGMTEQERSDAVQALEGRLLLGRQAPAQILDRYMTERALGLTPGALDAAVHAAAALSVAEVNATVRRFFEPAAFTLVELERR
jgi:zinc protease